MGGTGLSLLPFNAHYSNKVRTAEVPRYVAGLERQLIGFDL